MGLYAFPPVLLLGLAIITAVAAACGGQLLFRRFTGSDLALIDNDIAGFLVAIVGTLYAVMLGFMAVEVWDHYDAAKLRVYAEAASALDVWHDAVGLPANVRSHLRSDMIGYAKTMISKEWPAMRAGSFSPEGDQLIMDATTANGTFNPRNTVESNDQTAIIGQLNQMHDLRASRLAANVAAISPFQWLILAIGGIVLVAFCWLFGAQHVRTHLLMTGAIVVIIAAMFVLIFELQCPFRSETGISAEAWNAMIMHVESMDAAPGSMSMKGTKG